MKNGIDGIEVGIFGNDGIGGIDPIFGNDGIFGMPGIVGKLGLLVCNRLRPASDFPPSAKEMIATMKMQV